MQWLIFGATGYTGGALLDRCIAGDISVCAHVRPSSSSLDVVKAKVESALHSSCHVCPFEASAITELVKSQQPTHIALCLGTTRARSKTAKEKGDRFGYTQVDRNLSLMVIEAAQALELDTKIVYISSMGADKPRGNAYLQARYDVEQYLMGSGLAYTIVRPAFISGADRNEWRMGERFGAIVGDALLGFGALLGQKKMQESYASMSASELAAGLLSASQSSEPAQLLYPQHLRYHLKMR